MTIELMALHARRKAFFLEDLKNRRIQTRVDVYMEALKKFANKQVYDLEDSDVLDFLIYKDINNSGKTSVHHAACPYVGHPLHLINVQTKLFVLKGIRQPQGRASITP